MRFFAENRFIFEDKIPEGIDLEAGAPKGLIDASLDKLSEESLAKLGSKEEIRNLSKDLGETLTKLFEGGDFKLESDLDEYKIAEKLAAFLFFPLNDADIVGNQFTMIAEKDRDAFAKQMSKLMAKKVKKAIAAKYPKLVGVKTVEGVMNVKVKIENGMIDVEVAASSELLGSLNAISDAMEGAKERVSSTVTEIFATEEVLKVFGKINDSYEGIDAYFNDNEKSFMGKIRDILKDNILLQAGMDDDVIFVGIKDEIFSRIGDSLRGQLGLDEFNADAAMGVNAKIKVSFSGTEIKVKIAKEYAKEYETAAALAVGETRKNVEELKGGMVGWVLANVFDIKDDATYAKIVGGGHPFSYLFGAIAFVTGGASYPWALEYWTKVKRTLGKNDKIAGIIDTVEKGAKTFSDYVGKYVDDSVEALLAVAVAKTSKDFKKVVEGGEKIGVKGVMLVGDFDLDAYKSLELSVPEGKKVIFPKPIGGIKNNGDVLGNVKELDAGTYDFTGLSIIGNTYFPPGAKFEFEAKD